MNAGLSHPEHKMEIVLITMRKKATSMNNTFSNCAQEFRRNDRPEAKIQITYEGCSNQSIKHWSTARDNATECRLVSRVVSGRAL